MYTSAPDLAIMREDAQRQGKRYDFEDVLLIAARGAPLGTAGPEPYRTEGTWSHGRSTEVPIAVCSGSVQRRLRRLRTRRTA